MAAGWHRAGGIPPGDPVTTDQRPLPFVLEDCLPGGLLVWNQCSRTQSSLPHCPTPVCPLW